MNSFKSKIEKIVEKYDCKDFDGYNIFRVLKLTNNEQLCDILEIKKKLTFFDIVK